MCGRKAKIETFIPYVLLFYIVNFLPSILNDYNYKSYI
jgi:hypothetical protein